MKLWQQVGTVHYEFMSSAYRPENSQIARKKRANSYHFHTTTSRQEGQLSLFNNLPRSTPDIRVNHWLLNKLDGYLHQHLSESELCVSELLIQFRMSRTSFHRKLVKLTGMSVTAYIRYFRLRTAADLMQQFPDKNIFEIAVMVGFENQSYFTKRFKEIFRCCPRTYRALKCCEKHD